ncbi:Pyrrolidone-carboxylate peptidase [Corynebacterium xerosis]|nr:Pyrrolidone-carboxylate peptidase [Corynebacterium xerosis]
MTIDVLLSGFEPFAGAEENESWQAVSRALPALRESGLRVEALELPVEFERAGDLLEQAVRTHRPALVIAVGLAAGRSGITPERVAINVRDARIPDNAGASPVDQPVVPDGPVGHFTRLPVKAMVAALDEAGIAGSVSQTAGTYVCNDVFYRLQHLLATDPELADVRGGFVHVPSADVVSPEAAASALTAMIGTIRKTDGDIARTGGAEH